MTRGLLMEEIQPQRYLSRGVDSTELRLHIAGGLPRASHGPLGGHYRPSGGSRASVALQYSALAGAGYGAAGTIATVGSPAWVNATTTTAPSRRRCSVPLHLPQSGHARHDGARVLCQRRWLRQYSWIGADLPRNGAFTVRVTAARHRHPVHPIKPECILCQSPHRHQMWKPSVSSTTSSRHTSSAPSSGATATLRALSRLNREGTTSNALRNKLR